MTDEETLIFDRGDVVYDDDPFKGEEDARPWPLLQKMRLVVSMHTAINLLHSGEI